MDANIKEINEVIEDLDLDETYASTEFEKIGYTYDCIDEDEDVGSFSRNVSWYKNIKLTKDDKSYNVYISGTALAEISYDRWVGTDCYTIESYSVQKSR